MTPDFNGNDNDVEGLPLHGFRGHPAELEDPPEVPLGLTIAISRESGARGGTIGRRVAKALGWQVLDQEMLQFLSMTELSLLDVEAPLREKAQAWVDGQLSALSATSSLEQDLSVWSVTQVILYLAVNGNVVLIGRGAGFLLPTLTTLHARLVAPFQQRVSYISHWLRVTREEAEAQVALRDRQRGDFLKSMLNQDPENLNGYDAILSSGRLGEDLCVDLLVKAAKAKQEAIWPQRHRT